MVFKQIINNLTQCKAKNFEFTFSEHYFIRAKVPPSFDLPKFKTQLLKLIESVQLIQLIVINNQLRLEYQDLSLSLYPHQNFDQWINPMINQTQNLKSEDLEHLEHLEHFLDGDIQDLIYHQISEILIWIPNGKWIQKYSELIFKGNTKNKMTGYWYYPILNRELLIPKENYDEAINNLIENIISDIVSLI